MLLSCWSCRKDEAKPNGEVRQWVFTAGREITDKQIKKCFIERAGTAFTVPPNTQVSLEPARFIKPDTVLFGASTIPFAVVKSGQQYLCYSPLVVRISTPNDIIHSLLKHASPLVPVPTSTGFSYLTKEVRVGYVEGDNLRVSRLHYRLKRTGSSGSFSEQSGSLFNEFNQASVARIGTGDTLAVQESSMLVPIQ
ncbi:hypothetical protein [Hymenobacter norwichensis]|uniref:hypothetical protein n=1 Tax=Hymenobacter norwichensis TaxID=223903 RepID=UPI0003B7B0B8|nr:hypothetical protein [Hymenobacter norwichensis]